MAEPTATLLVIAFAPFPAPTGAATRLAQRIVAFGRAGWSVDVLSPKTDALPHVSKYAGARILRVPMPQHRDSLPGVVRPRAESPETPASAMQRAGAFERAVKRQLQGTDYNAVYLFDAFAGPAVESAIHDVPVIYETVQDPLAAYDSDWLEALRERERSVLRWCAAAVAPSEETGRQLRTAGLSADKLHIVRPSADMDLFRPPSDGRRWSSLPIRIALAASSLAARDLSLLAEALLILPESLQVRVTVSSAVTPDARTRILAESVLRDRLSLRDPVLYDDLPPFYQEADLGLVIAATAVDRGRLQTVAEMMASGLATILPDIPSIREVVTDGREAVLVPPADVEALVRAITALAADPARCEELGQAARRKADELLNERVNSRRLLQLVGSLIGTHVETDLTEVVDTGTEWTPANGPRLRTATSTASTVPGRSPSAANRSASSAEASSPRARIQSAAGLLEDATSPEAERSSGGDARVTTETNPGRK